MTDPAFEHRFRCWEPRFAAETIEMDAASPHDGVFFATHHPVRLWQRAIDERTGGTLVSEEQPMADLLNPAASILLMPITGAAGSGKSHLVRWLYRRLLATEDGADRRRIVYVPKQDTTLRDVIHLMLDGISGKDVDDLRASLDAATSSLDPEQARKKLLADLGLRIEADTIDLPGEAGEIRTYLRSTLRSLLVDPFFERRFAADGGVLDRLVREAMDGRREGDKDEPFEFSPEDLNLTLPDIRKANAEAQDLYTLLHGDVAARREAAALLNDHLQPAIEALFGVPQEQLINVMRQARQQLLAEGLELFLFIEDFAILQGIQRDLLQSFTWATAQAGQPLFCSIRVVMAVTTGYFDRLGLDTVATRAGFASWQFNLDVDLGTSEGMPPSEVATFVGRYLNAAREGCEVLNAAFDSVGHDQPANTADWVPNHCARCPMRSPCHHVFGVTREGHGLYPFNRDALERMVSAKAKGERFDPRRIMGGVLIHTLNTHGEEIPRGQFPSALYASTYLQGPNAGRFGLDPNVEAELQRRDPPSAPRRSALLSFWGGGPSEVCNLAPAIHDAFDLPPLADAVTAVEHEPDQRRGATDSTKRDGETTVRDEGRSSHIEAGLAPARIDLTTWSRGEAQLSTELARRLRGLIFTALRDQIDWEAEFWRVQDVADRERGRFQQSSIEIENARGTRRSARKDRVEVTFRPVAEDAEFFLDTLRHDAYGSWHFAAGGEAYARYANRLWQLSESLLDALRATAVGGSAPDPVPAAAEFLIAGAQIAGLVPRRCNDEQLLAALIADISLPDTPERSAEWRELQSAAGLSERSRPRRSDVRLRLLQEIARAQGGGQVRALDVARVLAHARDFARTWTWSEGSDEERATAQPVITAAEVAVAAERSRLDAVLTELRTAFGEDDPALVADEVSRVIQSAADFVGTAAEQLKDKLRAVKVSGARIVRELGEELADLPQLSVREQIIVLARPRDAELADLRLFAREANTLLDRALSTLENRIAAIGAAASTDGQPVGVLLDDIEALLQNGESAV